MVIKRSDDGGEEKKGGGARREEEGEGEERGEGECGYPLQSTSPSSARRSSLLPSATLRIRVRMRSWILSEGNLCKLWEATL